jgi:transcriptional regulator with XRE-family HTH domain
MKCITRTLRTGVRKSALSRLENSKAPNPTLASLQRYAEALDTRICVTLEKRSGRRRKQ